MHGLSSRVVLALVILVNVGTGLIACMRSSNMRARSAISPGSRVLLVWPRAAVRRWAVSLLVSRFWRSGAVVVMFLRSLLNWR